MRRWNRVHSVCWAAVIGCLAASLPARAADIFENIVITSAPVLDIDPSLRSVGMGGASSAVFWGYNPNYWANPALLGSMTGVRFEASDVALLPVGFPDLKYRTRRTTLGVAGLGVALSGEPFEGLGEQRLSYGELPLEYASLGLLPSYPKESVRSWGAGISLARGLGQLARWRGHDAPALFKHGDLELGFNRKTVTDNLVDRANPQRVTTWDYGVLARTSLPLRRTLGGLPGSVDVAYAFSVANANNARLNLHSTQRQYRNGVAMRGSIDAPPGAPRSLPRWVAAGVRSLGSVALAYDANHLTAGDLRNSGHDLDEWGFELGLADVLFGRLGAQRNSLGSGPTNNTWGVGVALPVGRWASLHYDHAHVERKIGGPVPMDSWAVQVNPLEMLRGGW